MFSSCRLGLRIITVIYKQRDLSYDAPHMYTHVPGLLSHSLTVLPSQLCSIGLQTVSSLKYDRTIQPDKQKLTSHHESSKPNLQCVDPNPNLGLQ